MSIGLQLVFVHAHTAVLQHLLIALYIRDLSWVLRLAETRRMVWATVYRRHGFGNSHDPIRAVGLPSVTAPPSLPHVPTACSGQTVSVWLRLKEPGHWLR